MWRLLYPFRTGAFHFRKQAKIGSCCVDFVCHHAKLVIEVDGDTHHLPGAQQRDKERDRFLRQEGYEVLRFSNLEVQSNPEAVFGVIEAKLSDRPRNLRSERTFA